MKVPKWMAVGIVMMTVAAVAPAQTPGGTVPRAGAESYPAHAQQPDAGVGVAMLTPAQIHKVFATEVGKCCVVLEVGLYPVKENAVNVSLDDFVLRVSGSDLSVRPSHADVVAARLNKKPAPRSGGPDVVITPTSSVGYETGGWDPATGQRRPRGVSSQAGVGVGVGMGGSAPPNGTTDADRRTMELELGEKALPEGKASAPVSGYLYFPLPSKNKKAAYILEYTLNGNKVVLTLQ